MNVHGPASRALMAALGAFCFLTVCWAAWGWATPGDDFANGSPLVFVTMVGASLVGLAAGWSAKGPVRLLIALLSGAALCYWASVPTGWWSHPLKP